mgnify:CR=1 FL=1
MCVGERTRVRNLKNLRDDGETGREGGSLSMRKRGVWVVQNLRYIEKRDSSKGEREREKVGLGVREANVPNKMEEI